MTLGAHLLGRVQPASEAHLRAYPFTAPPWASTASVEVNIARPTLSLYDQGQTPRCVGFSISKIMNFFNHYRFDADWLYAECKKIDGYPGDGTNATAACDVLRRQGHWRVLRGAPVKAGPKLAHGIASNRWAMDVDAIRSVLAVQHPVALGINWYDAWFNPQMVEGTGPRNGEYWLKGIPQAGAYVGGHEIGVWAASDRRQAFGLSNTWGKAWPALVWVPYETVTRLLAEGGDACVITDLATR